MSWTPPASATDQNPESAGHVAKLGGENRAEQRTGGGDGGKMVAEQNVFIGFYVIVTVIKGDSRGFSILAKIHDLGGQE